MKRTRTLWEKLGALALLAAMVVGGVARESEVPNETEEPPVTVPMVPPTPPENGPEPTQTPDVTTPNVPIPRNFLDSHKTTANSEPPALRLPDFSTPPQTDTTVPPSTTIQLPRATEATPSTRATRRPNRSPTTEMAFAPELTSDPRDTEMRESPQDVATRMREEAARLLNQADETQRQGDIPTAQLIRDQALELFRQSMELEVRPELGMDVGASRAAMGPDSEMEFDAQRSMFEGPPRVEPSTDPLANPLMTPPSAGMAIGSLDPRWGTAMEEEPPQTEEDAYYRDHLSPKAAAMLEATQYLEMAYDALTKAEIPQYLSAPVLVTLGNLGRESQRLQREERSVIRAQMQRRLNQLHEETTLLESILRHP